MSPPVCGACGEILSGSFYREGERPLCGGCGAKRRESATGRRVLVFVLIGLGGAVAGLGLYGFLLPRLGFGTAALASGGAVAASLVAAWFRRPALVDGPRPVGDPMPSAESERV